MMSRQKRELPLPGDVAPPPRRPLPGTPMAGPNQGPAPPLPSRGGGTPGRKALPTPEPPGKLPSRNPLDRRGDAHPIPSPRQSHASRLPPPTPSRGPPSHVQKQESVTSDDGDIYNEADVGEVYQECEPEQEEYSEFDVGAEVEEEPQETYDDFDIHADQQDTYEISDDVTDEVYQEMAEADPLPPPPPSRPIPQPPKNASPAPPPPPPPQSKRAPLEKKPARPKPPAVQKPMGGGLDLSEVLKKRGNLKKVESAEERPISSNDIKEYATGEDVRSKFEIFRQKEEADDSSSHADNLSVSSNIRDRMKMLQSNLPPPPKSQRTPPSLPKKTISNQIHPQTPTRPSQMKNNQFGRSASPDSHNFKSNFQTGSPELPPPPKMEDLQPPPPPKIKDSYTKVDPSTKSNVDSGKNTPLVQNGNQNDWPDDYDDDDGEIYDDVAATLADPLCAFPWYHNELEREEGNKKLKQISKDGCFLVRKASNKQRALTQPYTLMVYYSGYNYNLKVRLRSDQKFALGEEKADEVTFELVQDLICHHQKNEVILVHKSGKQYSTLLTVSPS
ncbi:proline-, glutamic acid- and leucine-rich protein 1-like isoform X3 [Pecten maximus]|uniref:proline-, glutamic acid- and leucine-rich protein 1-like isoform X3 n=1 Tax=Pecten maximus TaxID=6579 RepID=UPI0014581308|nr:proline-, glutamic acid- and leucine-rich protein 1-like isoform X3 [Pecten maximus]